MSEAENFWVDSTLNSFELIECHHSNEGPGEDRNRCRVKLSEFWVGKRGKERTNHFHYLNIHEIAANTFITKKASWKFNLAQWHRFKAASTSLKCKKASDTSSGAGERALKVNEWRFYEFTFAEKAHKSFDVNIVYVSFTIPRCHRRHILKCVVRNEFCISELGWPPASGQLIPMPCLRGVMFFNFSASSY